jgi:hypothetical protein
MNLNKINSLKPHVSYKKRLNVPTYPLFLSSQHTPDTYRNVYHHKENEIMPTIKWDTSACVNSEIEVSPEKIGFIILRHVNSSNTNEYWKECYRCIKRLYPKNRILIIDDDSDYTHVSSEPLENTMIIKSEYPKRGEFLPYYYYLRTKFCETAVILHDSAFIKKYIIFNVNNYKLMLEFGRECITDGQSIPYQKTLLSALNNPKLTQFYNKKDFNLWKGCFGAMSVVKYNYLKGVDSEFRIASLIPHITSRLARCAFERIIGCLLQVNINEPSLFGSIHKYCKWGLSYDEYSRNEYSNSLPLVKVWTGR